MWFLSTVILLLLLVVTGTFLCIVFIPAKWQKGDTHKWAIADRWIPILRERDHKHSCLRSLLCDVRRLMDKHDLDWFFSDGTALGITREGDVIQNDTDVDVGVFIEHKTKFEQTVLADMLHDGYRISKSRPLKVMCPRRRVYVDFDFIGLGEPSMSFEWPQLADAFYDTIRPIRRLEAPALGEAGVTYPVPSEAYLVRLYGEDWRVPQQKKPCDTQQEREQRKQSENGKEKDPE